MNKNFFALVAIILAGLIYPFFVSPLWQEVTVWQSDKAQVVLAQTKVDEFIKKFDDLEKKKEAFSEEDFEKLALILPESLDVIRTIVDIETIAQENNFILKGTVGVEEGNQSGGVDQNGAPLPAAPYNTTEFSINVVGPYSSLKPFIQSLSKSLTLFDVTAIQFSATETGVYDFQIKVRTYSLPKK
jgi:Tfp pilus assembly protein PilO